MGPDNTPIIVTLIRNCLFCKIKFETKVKKKVFCSNKCRIRDWMVKHPRVSTVPVEVTDRHDMAWDKEGNVYINGTLTKTKTLQKGDPK